jgi:succinate dehydrogenase flavin-adding protein (antitoxin of CptAB toxin-antitoxin module)
LLTDKSFDDLTGFKHLERPKEINLPLIRALFELFKLPSGHAQIVSQGDDAPVRELQSSITTLLNDLLTTQPQISSGLTLWGQNLLTDAEIKDNRTRLEKLKTFIETLSPYNTAGKLKNLRLTMEDIESQKANLASLDLIRNILKMNGDLGPLASYLAQAEMALPESNVWVATARETRSKVVADLIANRDFSQAHIVRQSLDKLKQNYIASYIGLHTKARLGVSEDKNRAGLTKDYRLTALTRLATINLMPSGQLTEFQDHLADLKSCNQLSESELAGSPVCPHCQFKPVNEALAFVSAANQLTELDARLDTILTGWTQTLLDNLEDPIIQENLELLKLADRTLVQSFLNSKSLPDPLTSEFITAVQEALSGLTKEIVKLADIQSALLAGGSPVTPEELKVRFDKFIAEHTRGKDANKLRFVVE